MAARPTWKGYIKVSLVTIPVRVYPATESSATISFNQLHAEYQEGLRAIIDAKIAGEEIVAPQEQTPPKVVDLMEALRKSLDQVSAGKKKTAKADAAVASKKVTNIKSAAKSAAKKRKAS